MRDDQVTDAEPGEVLDREGASSAGASVQVIADHYTHLTRDDAYDAMVRVLVTRRGR